MYPSSGNCISAYACVCYAAAQVEDWPVLSFMVAILSTTLILLLWTRTTSTIASEGSGGASQPADQPTPKAAVSERETQGPDLRTAFKVAYWVIVVSAGGIVNELAGLPGKENTELTHNFLFKAYTMLNYISLLLAISLFVLTLKRPNIRGLVMIVKYIMWMTVGSITYALGCATFLLLPKCSF